MARQQRIDAAIRVGAPLPEDLTEFRAEYSVTLKAARSTAEKKIGASLASKARSRTTCWDLLKRLRNPSRAVAIDADTMLKHFQSVFYDPSEPLFFDLFSLGIRPPENFEITLFTDNELCRALDLLNAQAATGPERVSSRYIKRVFQNQASRVPLLFLFNWCFREGRIPARWGISEVFVIYKGKGDITDPVNYRGINLNDDFV